MHRFHQLCAVLAVLALWPCAPLRAAEPLRPNIVYILCDDLGYGDVHALNPQRGKIATPNLDRLAAQSMVFTDAHSGSSVCTPTRYGILTGRYCWRTRLQAHVLDGTSPHLIDPGRLTVATLLRRHGYATACIGKWHLGMDWPRKPRVADREKAGQGGDIDYTKPITNGPNAAGFDYYFGISGSADMPPYTFIENDRVTVVPTVEKTWIRKGAAAADFEVDDLLPTLTRKAVAYVGERARGAKQGEPFFLYLALNSPHTPILPSKEWRGRSGLNAYADFVMQTDAAVGELLAALEKQGLTENTLVIFTSDNGCSPAAGIVELERKGHFPSAVYRGYKADIWDGGHRIPFLACWPGKIKPGSQSAQLICLTDLMATCADLLGEKLPDNAAEDSVSILPALCGGDKAPLREAVVHHSINGRFAIRQGQWKLEFCPGSGGWGQPSDAKAAAEGLTSVQLYDMTRDVGEQRNVCQEHPETVKRLTRLLEQHLATGRSTPGRPQKNDVPVDIWKEKASRP
jgi:arylsulfatase A-like enzyme